MKSMSQFVNLSIREQLEELNGVRIPRPNAEARRKAQEAQEKAEELEAEKYLGAFMEGANMMKEHLQGMRNPAAGKSLPYLDAIRLTEAVLCETCKFITRVQTATCPMCGSPDITDLSKLIAPLDAITKEN